MASSAGIAALPNPIRLASDGSDLSGIVSISAGHTFALALASSGKVYVWGENSYGQMAQNVQYGNYLQAVAVKDTSTSADLTGIVSISAGGNHGLALDSNGSVFSWGYSQHGELGDGANHPLVNQSLKPGAVVSEAGTGQLAGMVGVATGYSHSLALAPDGTIRIWGSGFRGNLGQGEAAGFPDSFVPLTVKNESGSAALSLGPLKVTRDSYRRYR